MEKLPLTKSLDMDLSLNLELNWPDITNICTLSNYLKTMLKVSISQQPLSDQYHIPRFPGIRKPESASKFHVTITDK